MLMTIKTMNKALFDLITKSKVCSVSSVDYIVGANRTKNYINNNNNNCVNY